MAQSEVQYIMGEVMAQKHKTPVFVGRNQRRLKAGAQLIFSSTFNPEPQITDWKCPHREWDFSLLEL